MKMKRLFITSLLVMGGVAGVLAQTEPVVQGSTYFLPRTALRMTMLVEKTTYTPGEYAKYAEKYLKRTDINMEPSVRYRITGMKLTSYGVPDSTKEYTAKIDAKHSIRTINRDENGVLLAVNATPRTIRQPKAFVPAAKQVQLNPKDYMSAEILAAGNTAKTAELCAQEIYSIRESKSLLTKGQADFMPKDGEQLRIMLKNLDTQEAALTQLFEGTTVKDTVEKVITYIPTKEVNKELLFRFSQKLGFTDNDDLAGKPYFITIEDLQSIPTIQTTVEDGKKVKDNAGIYVNLPGKISITLHREESVWGGYELYAAQFGRTEALSGNLFGKKYSTSLVLNPVTGNVESINTEVIK